jgi:hypothetical protein
MYLTPLTQPLSMAGSCSNVKRGQCHEIFTSGIFYEYFPIRTISTFFAYSHILYIYYCGKFSAGVITVNVKNVNTDIVDILRKLFNSVSDTGGQFSLGVVNISCAYFREHLKIISK